MHLSWVGVSKALVMHGQKACLSLSRGGRIPVMVTVTGYALPAQRQSFVRKDFKIMVYVIN